MLQKYFTIFFTYKIQFAIVFQLFLFNFCFSQNTTEKKKELFDLEGRIIVSEQGQKINYKSSTLKNSQKTTNKTLPNTTSIQNPCAETWVYSIFGTNIGENSLKAIDLDSDGTKEIIASADVSGGYWYILKYNSNLSNYEIIWSSKLSASRIKSIKTFDANNDGVKEIYVGYDSGLLEIYNAQTMEITKTLSFSNASVYDIEIGDLNNDNANELIVLADSLFIINASNYFIETKNYYPFSSFNSRLILGNVDSDPNNEIVLSTGLVLEYNGTNLTTQWDFSSNGNYSTVKLSDIDGDNKKEIIVALNWYTIHIFDADLMSLKRTITADLDIGDIYMFDVNNDLIDELIYGDGQWGELHCINSNTGVELWNIPNPNHGVTNIEIADLDNDGALEIAWGAGASSSGGDTLYIHNLNTKLFEWKSKALDGPFNAIDIGDIDNDGNLEIVTISSSSGSSYNAGVIVVFDAITHAKEWQSSGTFLGSTWEDVHDVKLSDMNNDGALDIIIAAGSYYDGRVWIINGITKTIINNRTYTTENIDGFFNVDVADVDNDGTKEIVASGRQFCIINPSDLSIEWSSPQIIWSTTKLLLKNVDTDPALEIVGRGNNNIYIIDGISHSIETISGYNFTNFELFNYDADSALEIIATDDNGYIHIYNHSPFQLVFSAKVGPSSIDGIKAIKINNDSIPEFLFSCDGVVFSLVNYTNANVLSYIGGNAGSKNSIKSFSNSGATIEDVIVGNETGIHQLNNACYNCISFAVNTTTQNTGCGSYDNGSISITPINGSAPYTYAWSTGATINQINNLYSGTYSVTINDSLGCTKIIAATVNQSPNLQGYITATPTSCDSLNSGTALASIFSGTPPFIYNWSNGDTTQQINHLLPGGYSLIITDSAGCEITLGTYIEDQTNYVDFFKYNITCNGDKNGIITSYASNNYPPISYQWSNGSANYYLDSLSAGQYSVVVTDGRGCIIQDTFEITEPDVLTVQMAVTPDDPLTQIGEGTAIAEISGGIKPYYLKWDNDVYYTFDSAKGVLNAGVYTLIIRNNYYCFDTLSYEIKVSSDEMFAFPNPFENELIVEVNNNYETFIEIFDALGHLIFTSDYFKYKYKVNTETFAKGTYVISINQLKTATKYKLIKR